MTRTAYFADLLVIKAQNNSKTKSDVVRYVGNVFVITPARARNNVRTESDVVRYLGNVFVIQRSTSQQEAREGSAKRHTSKSQERQSGREPKYNMI